MKYGIWPETDSSIYFGNLLSDDDGLGLSCGDLRPRPLLRQPLLEPPLRRREFPEPATPRLAPLSQREPEPGRAGLARRRSAYRGGAVPTPCTEAADETSPAATADETARAFPAAGRAAGKATGTFREAILAEPEPAGGHRQ
jgi:hypothetical protein